MRKIVKALLLAYVVLFCNKINAQLDGDYRTVGTGNWSNIATWQTRVASIWVAAIVAPNSTNNVYVQSTHQITVDVTTASCNELHLNVNSGGNNGRVIIGSNILEVNGKQRNYTVTLGANIALGVDGAFYTDQVASTSYQVTAMSSTAGIGLLRYVGNTRTLFVTGELGAGGTTNLDIDFALTSGQTATLETTFKARNITFSSGNYIFTNTSGIRPDGNATGTGTLTVNNGVTLELASSVSIQRIAAAGATAHCSTITFANGSVLNYTGAPSTIGASAINFNGTVWYSSNSNQTLVNVGANSASALPNVYTNLTLNAGIKTLAYNTTVNEVLSMRTSTSAVPVLALGGFALNYGTNATLQYRGIGSPPPAQTTADTEWPTAGSLLSIPPNIDIFTATPVTINNNKSITGDLRMSGSLGQISKIVADVYNLSVATITRQNPDANKFIATTNNGTLTIRNIGASNVLFPIGPSSSLYHPITLLNTGSVDDYTIKVSSTNPACLSNLQSVNVEWDVTESTIGGSYVGLSMDYSGASTGASFVPAAAVVAHCNSTVVDASSGTATGTVVTGGPFTSFSPFGITSNVSILPLKLICFKAINQSNNILINWKTVNEETIFKYELWHSLDGTQFSQIKTVNKENGNYVFLHISPLKGINYYKLKMISNDGSFQYSHIEKVDLNKKNELKIYPTITDNRISILNNNEMHSSFTIINIAGKKIFEGKLLSNNTIDVSKLKQGFYFLLLKNEKFKFLKQ
jgi:hypothetical protein